MKKHGIKLWNSILLGFALLTGQAIGSTWTDAGAGGDHLWTDSGNWDSGVPGAGDTANFPTNVAGTNIVNSDRTVAQLWYDSYTDGFAAHETQIGNGITLTASSELRVGCVLSDHGGGGSTTCRVDITGSGTLKVGSTVYIGSRDYSGNKPNGTLSLNGVTLLINNVSDLQVGYCDQPNAPAAYGTLDLGQAGAINSGLDQNCLIVSDRLSAGCPMGSATLRLPPNVTNVTCGRLLIGNVYQGYNTIPYSCLDFGTNPTISSLTVANDVVFGKTVIIYNDGSNQKTGFPPTVAVRIGSSNAPGTLKIASSYATEADTRVGGFRSFEGWLKQLYLGVAGNSYTSYGELDLTDTNTQELAGSFANGSMNVHDVRMGGNDANGTGVLKLPASMTNITVGILQMGYMGNLSKPPDSVISLGSNSLLQSLTISNEFRLGLGHFEYINGSGNTIADVPTGVRMHIGSPTARASTLYIGDSVAQGSVTRFGSGVTEFTMYVINATVGRGYGGGHAPLGELNLSNATNMVFDVQGTFQIAEGLEGWGYVNLFGGPNGGRGSASNLYLNPSGGALAAHLVLSNVQFSVSNELVVKSCTYGAKITNYANQVASGIDLGSTNLTLPDGSMHIVFQADPPNQILPYWGLRLKGDAVAQINALTTTPAKVTYDISGLSAKYQAKFGVFYDARTDKTILGIPSVVQGTIFVVH